MKTLQDISIGDTSTVLKVSGEGALRRRIMDMGITKGTAIKVRGTAPFGDPIEISVRGYQLTIRKSEAATILVK